MLSSELVATKFAREILTQVRCICSFQWWGRQTFDLMRPPLFIIPTIIVVQLFYAWRTPFYNSNHPLIHSCRQLLFWLELHRLQKGKISILRILLCLWKLSIQWSYWNLIVFCGLCIKGWCGVPKEVGPFWMDGVVIYKVICLHVENDLLHMIWRDFDILSQCDVEGCKWSHQVQ